MPRSRSLIVSSHPILRLFVLVVFSNLSSHATSGIQIIFLCHLGHHRTCLSTNCAISCTTESVCLPIMPCRASSNLSCSSHRRPDLVLAVPIKLVSTYPATSPPITLVSSDCTHCA